MIKHSPSEYYLKYLLVHPACYLNQYVKDVSVQLELDVLGDWYLGWLRDQLRPPAPFYPEDPGHEKSQRFLLKERLEQAFQPNGDMQRAMHLLGRPRVRELVETMVLSGAPDGAIANAAFVRFKFRCDDGTIKLYRHYFWNIELLTGTEMRALLDLRNSAMLDSTEPSMKNQYPSLNRMRHSDPRVVAARLPQSSLMGLIAQSKAGVMPKNTEISAMADLGYKQCMLKAIEALETGGPAQVMMAQQLVQTAEAFGRIRTTVANPEADMLRDLARIKMATTSRVVPTIQQLTGGNHTAQLQPMPKSEEAEDDSDES